MWFLYLLGAAYAYIGIVWAIDRIKKIPIDIREKKRVEELEKDTEQREAKLQLERAHFEELKKESSVALVRISKEKSLGFGPQSLRD